jgi:hypothetical protein
MINQNSLIVKISIKISVNCFKCERKEIKVEYKKIGAVAQG